MSVHTLPMRRARRPGRPPGPSQAPQLRETLLEEASRLYAVGGYAGLSYGPLAAHAGVTKATLFHYFPNKDALLYAIFERFAARLEAATAGWFEPASRSFAERLDHVVGALIDFWSADPLHAKILCHGLLEAEHIRPARLGEADAVPVFGGFVARFVAFVRDGIVAREFHDDRPFAIVMAIGGIVLFECMQPDATRGRYGGRVGRAARRTEMIALVRRAVVRPASRLRNQRRASR